MVTAEVARPTAEVRHRMTSAKWRRTLIVMSSLEIFCIQCWYCGDLVVGSAAGVLLNERGALPSRGHATALMSNAPSLSPPPTHRACSLVAIGAEDDFVKRLEMPPMNNRKLKHSPHKNTSQFQFLPFGPTKSLPASATTAPRRPGFPFTRAPELRRSLGRRTVGGPFWRLVFPR